MLRRMTILGVSCAFFAISGFAEDNGCASLPSQTQLKNMLTAATYD